MKTKNILKIGVLSIILLSLLISPILKSNIFQVKAEEKNECELKDGICIDKKAPGTCATRFNYKESTLSCGVGDSKQCCVPSDSPDATPPQTERAKYVEENSITDATGTAKESSAAKICNILIYNEENPSKSLLKDVQGAWNFVTGSGDDRWWAHKVCVFQIGALEGIGKMISGTINSLTANITWALNPDTYGGFVKNKGVIEVWNILRNFMNLALILILIIIAVSTILGIKKYRWQEILWKLVLIALLINFSLILPGILLDISHFITFTFINLTQDLNDTNIAQSIMNFYLTDEISSSMKFSLSNDDTQNTIKVEEEEIKMSTDGWGLAWGNFFLVTAALSLIGLFALITLIAILFTTIFRSFMIIILLAVSPIAFAAWVLPNTEKFWQMWWGQFTRWCLFPVTFSISLYAGIVVLNGMHDHLAVMGASNEKLGIIAMIVQIILFSMFLIGGLIASIQSGGAVAKVVQKQVSSAGWLAGVLTTKKIVSGVQKTQTYRNVGQKLTHVPLFSSLGHGMLDKSDSVQLTSDIKKYEKEMEVSRDKSSIMDTVNRKAPSRLNKASYTHYMAARNIALKKGWLNSNDTQVAIDEIKNDVLNRNSDLNATITRNALPQYFKIENGELEILDQSANDYQDQVINNLNKINPTDLPKNTEKIVSDVGGDINEFIEKIARLKANKFKAFLDNVSDEEYSTGKVFGGTKTEPKSWDGPNGEVAQRLNQRVADTLKAYEDATDLNGDPISGYTKSQIDDLENKWIAAQATLDKLNRTLNTSPSLQETLRTKII